MKLCSYVVRRDTGFAPNPFWGYYTLAACTPNHMGIHLRRGDWIIGTGSVKRGNKLIYAMRVAEVLHFERYYTDPRFATKKPVSSGNWRQRCGDNIYHKDELGAWQQDSQAVYHRDEAMIKKDLKHPYVFVAEHFYYFGNEAVEIPLAYEELIWRRQGCKCKHDPGIVEGFLGWLQTSFKPGVYGKPRDNDDLECKGYCSKV